MENEWCSICRQVSAKFTCSCANPFLFSCEACILAHLESLGTHIPVLIQNEGKAPTLTEENNKKCDECRRKTARNFCLCSVPLKKLCKECDTKHYQKAYGTGHFHYPIAAYEYASSGKLPFETFRRKQIFVNEFQLRIAQELARFDAFAKEVIDEFGSLIASVTARKEAALLDIQRKRSQLVGQLGEIQQIIEGKRYAEPTIVVTPLDDYIENGYQSGAIYDVKLFTGSLELREIQEKLENSVSVEVLSDMLEQNMSWDIPVLNVDSLRLFNRKTLEMRLVALDKLTRIDRSSAYCYIGTTTLLAVGGQSHSEAYEVDIETGEARKVANMLTARFWTGIIKYQQYVYVIGGHNSSQFLNTAEKYAIEAKSWTSLTNTLQKALYSCSVCEHSSGLYISGIDQAGSSIEYFNPNHETFRLLRSDAIKYSSILCCVGEDLYHIRQDKIEVARLTEGPAVKFTVKAYNPQIGNGYYWLCCPLKVVNGELMSVLNHIGAPTGIFSLKPVQGRFTQVANFTY